jgi:hypothetical protein
MAIVGRFDNNDYSMFFLICLKSFTISATRWEGTPTYAYKDHSAETLLSQILHVFSVLQLVDVVGLNREGLTIW